MAYLGDFSTDFRIQVGRQLEFRTNREKGMAELPDPAPVIKATPARFPKDTSDIPS